MVSFQVMVDSEAIEVLYNLVNSGRGSRLLNVQEYYTETVQKKKMEIFYY